MATELPIGAVCLSFREAPTSARAAMLAADQGPDAPSQALLASGAASGVVRVETCSRVAWVISSREPAWAASLLRAGLLAAAGEAALGREPRIRVGRAALDHVLRVSLGLDAVVEGERAVGRQVLAAFDRAHAAGWTDATLHLVWRAIGDLLGRRGPGTTRQRGVQSLVAARLQEAGLSGEVLVLGTGEIGRAVGRAVPGARLFARRELPAFERAAKTAPAVVVCTGGPRPWLALPLREDTPLAVDLGSPAQVAAAPGWRVAGLDELLTGGLALPEAEQARLVALVEVAREDLAAALLAPPPAATLAALDAERRAFLAEELPELSRDLSPEAAAALRDGVHRLGHRLIRGAAGAPRLRMARQEGSS